MSTSTTKSKPRRSLSGKKRSKSVIHVSILSSVRRNRKNQDDRNNSLVLTNQLSAVSKKLPESDPYDRNLSTVSSNRKIIKDPNTFANPMDYQIDKRKQRKKEYRKLFRLIIIVFISLILCAILIGLTMSLLRTTKPLSNSCPVRNVTVQPQGGFGGTSVLYTFDNTMNDYYSNYNAVPLNNPEFISPGYNGRGSAIQFIRNRSQCLSIVNHMDFYNKSFTVEAWVYPFTVYIPVQLEMAVYSQINSTITGQYMFISIRSGKILGAFYAGDVVGSTIFQENQWQHFAFTYNLTTKTQTAYFNGISDGTRTNAQPCQIQYGIQNIGCFLGTEDYFDGYIDQLAILFNRSKTNVEILADATLVAYYSMDCTTIDSGPNHMASTAVDLSSGDDGRVQQSFLFNLHSSYFQVTQLLLLGQSCRSFSFAMWLRPIVSITLGGTILHLSRNTDGTGSCAQLIGLSSLGQIVVHGLNASSLVELVGPVLKTGEWIHIVETYSQTNGLRLYVNGTLSGQSSPFSYAASGVLMTVTLGQALNGENCLHGTIRVGYYRGEIDEFYIYSRELSQAHVTALVNA